VHVASVEGLRARITSHLGSDDVARVLYGAVVGLALVIALQDHPPPTGTMAATIVGTALAVGIAELYAEAISTEARTRRRLTRAQLRHMVRDGAAVVIGAGFPAVFFILAAAGWIQVDSAFTLSKWSGLALICSYGFMAGRLAGLSTVRSILHATAIALLGVAVIVVKALLH
jgi:hypothetical protein